MKRIFLTAGAVFSFILAGAQTTPQTPAPTGGKPVKTDVMEQNKREMQPKPDAVTNPQEENDPVTAQPAVKATTGEPVTRDHAKSTPPVNRGRDTTTVAKPRKAKKH